VSKAWAWHFLEYGQSWQLFCIHCNIAVECIYTLSHCLDSPRVNVRDLEGLFVAPVKVSIHLDGDSLKGR
jgi:hypothetical protein